MTSAYNKEILVMLKNVVSIDKVNWSVVWELLKDFDALSGFEVSRHDNRGDRSPFEKGAAYLNIKEEQEEIFRELFKDLLSSVAGNIIGLSNCFIIYWSLSGREEFVKAVFQDYMESVNENCIAVYNELIQSLNTQYYEHHHYQKLNSIIGVEKWLDVFRSAQYFMPFHDPVIAVTKLIRPIGSKKIGYKYILPMKPILRAVIVEWYHFDIDVEKEEILQTIQGSLNEASFWAAILLDDMAPDAQAPDWLDAEILNALTITYWPEVGSRIFLHTFGPSYRNKNKNPLYAFMKVELKQIFIEIINNSKMSGWENAIEFPNGFIAFFGWVREHGTEHISDAVEAILREKFISELERICRDSDALVDKSNKDRFSSYNYGDVDYQNTFPYFLWLLLGSDEAQMKRIEHSMFDIKPFFYGGFTSMHFAKSYVEFVLLTLTSITQLSNLDEAQGQRLVRIIKIVCNSVMVPYSHLVERDNEIWDPLKDGEISFYSLSVALLNMRFQSIQNSPYHAFFIPLFDCINSVKVAQWPFERITDLSSYYRFRQY